MINKLKLAILIIFSLSVFSFSFLQGDTSATWKIIPNQPVAYTGKYEYKFKHISSLGSASSEFLNFKLEMTFFSQIMEKNGGKSISFVLNQGSILAKMGGISLAFEIKDLSSKPNDFFLLHLLHRFCNTPFSLPLTTNQEVFLEALNSSPDVIPINDFESYAALVPVIEKAITEGYPLEEGMVIDLPSSNVFGGLQKLVVDKIDSDSVTFVASSKINQEILIEGNPGKTIQVEGRNIAMLICNRCNGLLMKSAMKNYFKISGLEEFPLFEGDIICEGKGTLFSRLMHSNEYPKEEDGFPFPGSSEQ